LKIGSITVNNLIQQHILWTVSKPTAKLQTQHNFYWWSIKFMDLFFFHSNPTNFFYDKTDKVCLPLNSITTAICKKQSLILILPVTKYCWSWCSYFYKFFMQNPMLPWYLLLPSNAIFPYTPTMHCVHKLLRFERHLLSNF
jgi:hypothetical protein